MNQYIKRAFLWGFLLMICVVLLGSCIQPTPGDFHTTNSDIILPPQEITNSTTPDETSPMETTPQDTSIAETTTQKEPTTEPIVETTTVTTPETTETTETTTEETSATETTSQETTTESNDDVPPIKKIKIYIDQGHNPHSWNTGAHGNGLKEEDLTFEIGILLAELLAQDERFEVRLSRPTANTLLGTDNDSALDARINDAEEWGADYFISLHINSFTTSSVNGVEMCYAPDDVVGKELGMVLIDSLAESTGLNKRIEKARDNLRVLTNTTMPATLLEMGFISNEDDAKLLDESPELFAQGVYNGILNYFNDLEENTTAE